LFDDRSTQIKADRAGQTLGSMGFLQGVDPKCVVLQVNVVSDRTETSIENDQLGAARASAVRRFLKAAGFPDERMDIQVSIGHLDSSPAAVPIRWAVINWSLAKGRYRCDPAIERKPNSCGYDTSSCYWELTDGTICNFNNVPDPNPAKYSVYPAGGRIQ
jgi:hypothetical protein